MTEDQKVLMFGVYLFGALYLAMVFVAAIVDRNNLARNLAIVAVAFGYVGYGVQVYRAPFQVQLYTNLASVIVAIAAGVLLLETF